MAASTLATAGPQVILEMHDGFQFYVMREVAELSGFIKNMLPPQEGQQELQPISVPISGEIQRNTMLQVLEFLEHRLGHPMPKIKTPVISSNIFECVDEWNATFISRLSQPDLFSIVNAANYLDISDLLELACAQIAALIKGKAPEEIRR